MGIVSNHARRNCQDSEEKINTTWYNINLNKGRRCQVHVRGDGILVGLNEIDGEASRWREGENTNQSRHSKKTERSWVPWREDWWVTRAERILWAVKRSFAFGVGAARILNYIEWGLLIRTRTRTYRSVLLEKGRETGTLGWRLVRRTGRILWPCK